MSEKSCFLIGHRNGVENLAPLLWETLRRHILEEQVTTFLVGGYGQFDRMAARLLADAKECYPHLTLFLLTPYHPAERPLSLPKGFDGIYYPAGMERVPRRSAIVRANRYAVDHVDYLIACVWHTASNARELLEYARRREARQLFQVTVLGR